MSNAHGLLSSPWDREFDSLVESASKSLILCAPFITRGPYERIASLAQKSGVTSSLNVSILTNLSRDSMLSGAIDVLALLKLTQTFPATQVRILPSLHAKVYIADEKKAIITSANLTEGGLKRNFEYGVVLTKKSAVEHVKRDALSYAALGSPVSEGELKLFAEIITDLREVAAAAQRTMRASLRIEFNKRLAAADIEILRVRSAGRTAHAIFADAIIHLLRSGPMRTVEIHQQIRTIHPDLCDDTVDRVIEGRHFGKKWKHAVRTAQVYLWRVSRIEKAGNRWQFVR